MPNVLITGSNRGLGIEWVRQYADEGWRVFATCRRPTEAVELNDLAVSRKNVTVHPLDVIKTDGINALAVELIGADTDAAGGISVVSYLHGNHIFFTGGGLCHAQGQFIGFTA